MNRRDLLKKSFMGAAATVVSLPLISKAQQCLTSKTPAQTEGPFYPIKDQVDKDNDLTFVNGRNQTAIGEIIVVEGVVTDQHCRPVKGVLVEIWQACASGKYNHPSDPNTAPIDPNFQYWGKAITDDQGVYRFLTIKPGSYPADVGWVRPPHIHFKVSALGYIELITQMYFAEDSVLNNADLILKRLKKSEQKSVIVTFEELESSPYKVGNFPIQIEKI